MSRRPRGLRRSTSWFRPDVISGTSSNDDCTAEPERVSGSLCLCCSSPEVILMCQVRSLCLCVLLFASGASWAAAAPCASLSSLSLPHMTLVSASDVPPGQLKLPADAAPPNAPLDVSTLPSFCRVTAVSRPSEDSEIALEVWLPAATWNTQFQPVGNGLWGGAINYAGLIGMVRAGYATASNDTGHRGAGASF